MLQEQCLSQCFTVFTLFYCFYIVFDCCISRVKQNEKNVCVLLHCGLLFEAQTPVFTFLMLLLLFFCLLVLSKSAFVHDRHIFLFHHVVPESKSDFPHFHINVYIQRNI